MALPELAPFALVGGTNLALRLGHRISVDIDLFSNTSFDLDEVREAIASAFPQTTELAARNQTLLCQINGIKTDLIRHQYQNIAETEDIGGIRLASMPDVIAMKLGAVAGRGAKKDFWDIHALLPHFDLATMVGYFQEKYPASDPGQVVRSLIYFDDADPQPDPIDLLKITWPDVKNILREHVRAYTNDIL
jgi:hypothetical protein